jgi:hypothetical protein
MVHITTFHLLFRTWSRFFAALPFTFEASNACLLSCKQNSVKDVFVTIWGDDGNECDLLSALPGIAYFAEHGYTPNEVNQESFERTFAGICGGNLQDFVSASKIDILPKMEILKNNNTQFPVILLVIQR